MTTEIEAKANDAAMDMARECMRQVQETGQPRAATMRVGARNVLFAGATAKGGTWWIPVPFKDEETKREVIGTFPEIIAFAE